MNRILNSFNIIKQKNKRHIQFLKLYEQLREFFHLIHVLKFKRRDFMQVDLTEERTGSTETSRKAFIGRTLSQLWGLGSMPRLLLAPLSAWAMLAPYPSIALDGGSVCVVDVKQEGSVGGGGTPVESCTFAESWFKAEPPQSPAGEFWWSISYPITDQCRVAGSAVNNIQVKELFTSIHAACKSAGMPNTPWICSGGKPLAGGIVSLRCGEASQAPITITTSSGESSSITTVPSGTPINITDYVELVPPEPAS